MENFPSNSHKNKPEPKKEEKPKKEIESVVTGKVIQKKKGFGHKFREVFLGMELKSASRYIAADVLLPALRNTIVEATTRGIERLIYGDNAPQGRRPGYGGPRVEYHRANERFKPQQRAYLPRENRPAVPRRQDIADIILERREDAERVVEMLSDIIQAYDVVSVADLYSLVDIPSTYIDNNWGWSDIRYVNILQVREGWLIEMPRIEPIV